MKPLALIIFALCLFGSAFAETNPNCVPTQIHLSLGDAYYSAQHLAANITSNIKNNQNQAYLVWHSQEVCKFLVSVTNLDQSEKTVVSSSQPVDFYQSFTYDFVVATEEREGVSYKTVVYTALIDGLNYGTWYTYVIENVVDKHSITPINFRLASPYLTNTTYQSSGEADETLINKTITNQIIVMGNLDSNNRGMSTIQTAHDSIVNANETFAAIIQLGKIACNLEDENGAVGDKYFNDIQDLTSVTPLVVASAKNDKYKYTFLDLRIRNPLFNQTNNRYFSYNLQGIHFLNIDFDFYEKSAPEVQSQIFSWIENDLKIANRTDIRKMWPFVVVTSSQSIYCIDSPSKEDRGRGCSEYYYERQKWDILFFNYNVDLMISASEVSYQRMWPMFKNEAQDFVGLEEEEDAGRNYILDPPATVYINEGIGGFGDQRVPSFKPSQEDALEAIDTDPGFGVLYVTNSTEDVCLTYDHYRSAKDGERQRLIDTVTLLRTWNSDGTLGPPRTNNSPSKLSTILKIAIPVLVFLLIAIIITVIICNRRKQKLQTALMNESSNSLHFNHGTEGKVNVNEII